jgi:hypothetical protein
VKSTSSINVWRLPKLEVCDLEENGRKHPSGTQEAARGVDVEPGLLPGEQRLRDDAVAFPADVDRGRGRTSALLEVPGGTSHRNGDQEAAPAARRSNKVGNRWEILMIMCVPTIDEQKSIYDELPRRGGGEKNIRRNRSQLQP